MKGQIMSTWGASGGVDLKKCVWFSQVFGWLAVVAWLKADPLDVWQWRNRLPQGNPLAAVRYANGQSVAVGGAGTILTSSNGVAWNQQISGTHADLEDVVFGNGQ